jgi:hypothetical protein
VKAHFTGGPWAGKTVELPGAIDPMDVQQGEGNHVRYRLARWEEGMPHYEVDGMPRVEGQERRFPMPADFPDALNAAMTRTDADAAIATVAAWLSSQAAKGDRDVVEAVAREFCYQLLESAGADGNGGCLLCQA